MKYLLSIGFRCGFLSLSLAVSGQLSAEPQNPFAACVVENSGDRPVLVCADEIIDIRDNFERSLTRIEEREIQAIAGSGIFRSYYRLLDPVDQSLVESLADLGGMLGSRYPDLYGDFIADVSSYLSRLKEQTTAQIERLVSVYQRFDPAAGEPFIGPEPPPTLEDAIRELAGELFIGSGEPAEIMALDTDPGPIVVQPLIHSSAEGAYFFADTEDIVESTHFILLQGTFCVRTQVCVWPSGWDFLPHEFSMIWESSTLNAQEIADIVRQDGYEMVLEVNGRKLLIGPPPGDSAQVPFQDYYVVAMGPTPTSDDYNGPICPIGRQCIATSIFAKASLHDEPFPWRVTLSLYRINPLDPPIVIIDRDSGEQQSWALGRELIGTAGRTITANSTWGQSFFVEALSNTFKSARCMDCHGFGNADALAEHHDFYGGLTTEQFIEDTGLHLVESAYVPGAHVIACDSCHYVPTSDGNGHVFEETEWKSPYQDLQVDWRNLTRAAICRRVRQNLPNHDIRMQHFSEDARLFWAIEEPWVMAERLEPQAYPGDFQNFLSRIFWWSLYVDDCPE